MSAGTKRVMTLTVGLIMLGVTSVGAQPHRRAVSIAPAVHLHRPFVYDPFWGPWYPYAYPFAVQPEASIRTAVTPKETEVYVDGYFAGHASDFDGIFKRLSVAPGGHAISFRMEGFRTVTQDVYVRPDSTFKMNTTMERLASGETTAPVPAPRLPAQGDRAPGR